MRVLDEGLRRELTWLAEGERPKSAAVIVSNGSEFLLLRRGMTAPWKPGYWNLPGGAVDPGESPKQAAVREAQEEASITPTGLKQIAKVDLGSDELGDLYVFLASGYRGTPKFTWESMDMRWVPKAEAHKMKLVPGLRAAIKKAARA